MEFGRPGNSNKNIGWAGKTGGFLETVKVTVTSAEKASRLELFIRFVWIMISEIVLGIIGVFAIIALLLQWLHILILGKRQPALASFVNSWLTAWTQLMFYTYLATDERSPIIPQF